MQVTGTIETIIKRLSFVKNDKEYVCKLEPYHKGRSLNANNYLWKLIGQLADVIGMPKDDMYLTMLKRYGQSEQIAVRPGVEVKKFCDYAEKAESGNGWEYWKVYKGSSKYTTKEMAILIDGVISECNEQGIETDTTGLTEMIKGWGNE